MRLRVYRSLPAALKTMASKVNKTLNYSLDKLWAMTCLKLREILKENKQNVTGNKQILVARCYALNPVIDERKDDTSSSSSGINDESVNENAVGTTAVDPFLQLETFKKIGFNELNLTAKGRQWETDLRMFPPLNFHQLYEYLVVRTQKYEEGVMKGVSHKKMKSYQFFKEGHIKTYEIARGFGKVWVKSKVVASMKHEMYRIIVVCKDDGDVLYGACECPAGYV